MSRHPAPHLDRLRYAAASLLLALGLCFLPMAVLRAQGEADFLAGHTKMCPNCSLQSAALKRKDAEGG